MSQKQNRRTVISHKKTYQVTLKTGFLQKTIDEIILLINPNFYGLKLQPIPLCTNVNNKTKNKAKRF
jgi:hypothetical protein